MKALGLAFALASTLSLPMPRTFEDIAFGIVTRQREPSSCGYAVLAGVLNLVNSGDFERPPEAPALVTEEYLLMRYGGELSSGNRSPLSMLDLIGILSDFGLGAVPMKLDAWLLGTALEAARPLIIHYDRPVSHFVLGLDADGEFLTVADPECGIVALTVSELAARASGFVLLPLPGGQSVKMENNALSAGIRAAKERRSTLALAASAPRAGSIQRKPAISPLHWEAAVSIGSSGRENGLAAVSPGIFFGMEWAASEALTLLGNAHIRLSVDPALIEALELSSGIEWHRENKEKNRSIGAAIFFAESVSGIVGDPGFSSLGPHLRFRSSWVVNPFLLTGTAGIRLAFPIMSAAEPQSGGTGESLFAFPSELSVLCAFSPVLIGKAALEQEFLFPMNGQSPLAWKAALALGMNIPMGSLLFYAGTKIRLDYGSKTNGEAVFSFAF